MVDQTPEVSLVGLLHAHLIFSGGVGCTVGLDWNKNDFGITALAEQ